MTLDHCPDISSRHQPLALVQHAEHMKQVARWIVRADVPSHECNQFVVVNDPVAIRVYLGQQQVDLKLLPLLYHRQIILNSCSTSLSSGLFPKSLKPFLISPRLILPDPSLSKN